VQTTSDYEPDLTAIAVAPRLHEVVRALQAENEQLRHALESHILIEQATGAVAVRCSVTPDVAFEMLRGLARSQRRKLAEFCEEVIENKGRLDGLPSPNGRVRSAYTPDRPASQPRSAAPVVSLGRGKMISRWTTIND
jgi:ANTAR domain